MKKLILLIVVLLVMIAVPSVLAVGDSVTTNISVPSAGFDPLIWMNPFARIVLRDPSSGGLELIERTNNYAFEGEQILWRVLVMDKNGIEDITSVHGTIGSVQGIGNDIEVACDLDPGFLDDGDLIPPAFNARIGEEQLEIFDADTMAVYTCILTVETPASMAGEFWVTVEVEDASGNQNIFDENEYWFFNPIIALAIDGVLEFEDVLPGSASYSDTLRITNDAEDDSGVLLDMTISGTDFYDPTSGGTKCPVSNRIRLNSGGALPIYLTNGAVNPAGSFVRTLQTNCDNPAFDEPGDPHDDLSTEDGFDVFCYFATNGAYSTVNDVLRHDKEGYVGIPYETGDQSNRAPIISSTSAADRIDFGGGSKEYFAGNVLSPGSDMSITFRLFSPEPCQGEFSDGQIFFWGEAI